MCTPGFGFLKCSNDLFLVTFVFFNSNTAQQCLGFRAYDTVNDLGVSNGRSKVGGARQVVEQTHLSSKAYACLGIPRTKSCNSAMEP